MTSLNQIIGIILIVAGLFDVLIFQRVVGNAMEKQNQPEKQINIAKRSIIFLGIVLIVVGIVLYAGVIG